MTMITNDRYGTKYSWKYTNEFVVYFTNITCNNTVKTPLFSNYDFYKLFREIEHNYE